MDEFLAVAGIGPSGKNPSPRRKTGGGKLRRDYMSQSKNRSSSAHFDMRKAFYKVDKAARIAQKQKADDFFTLGEEDESILRGIERGVKHSTSGQRLFSSPRKDDSSVLLSDADIIDDSQGIPQGEHSISNYPVEQAADKVGCLLNGIFRDEMQGPENSGSKMISRSLNLDFLSERDKAALKLGRMLTSSLLELPEVTTEDQISRFFLDRWLSERGSSVSQADTLSIQLLCSLEKACTEQGIDISEPVTNRVLCSTALEALDIVVEEFGAANPILKGILFYNFSSITSRI